MIPDRRTIIEKCIDEKWPVDGDKHTKLRNKLAKLSSWGIEEKAMSEYAKEVAIDYAHWVIKKLYPGVLSDGTSREQKEQLFDQYLTHLQNKKQP